MTFVARVRRAKSTASIVGLIVGASVSGDARAQTTDAAPHAPPPQKTPAHSLRRGLPVMDTACATATDFGGTDMERAGFCALERGALLDRYLDVRIFAEEALRQDKDSYRANFLMGAAQHLSEANLPKALFFLERAKELLSQNVSRSIPKTSPAFRLMRRILLELVYVHGEMDHHVEKIRAVDEIFERLGLDYSPLGAWPKLKLGRFEEARHDAEAGIGDTQEDSDWAAIGRTALCAVESEMRRREESFQACMAAAKPYLDRDTLEGGVALSNAAATAYEMMRFDLAEQLYVESSRRAIEGTVNPWGRLVHLYVRQGRFSEALSALREMVSYLAARPPWLDQQDQSDAELTQASLLMVAGRMQDTLRITQRASNRPDRQGTASGDSEQNEAGALVMDRVATLDVARRYEEEASWSSWTDAIRLRAKAVHLRFLAWISGQKVRRLLMVGDRLKTSLRPECPGSIELPAWLDAEVIGLVGSAVAKNAIAIARAEESLPANLTEPFFSAFLAEVELLAGNHEDALRYASDATTQFAASEALLIARAAAVGAEAALKLRRRDVALGLAETALVRDPGVFRRMGFSIPVSIVNAGGPAAAEAASYLAASPRFDARGGFELVVDDDAIALIRSDKSELFRARVEPEPAPDDVVERARAIAKAAHEDLLTPMLDLTQADIRSLDGSVGAGGRASERAKNVLEELLERP